MPAPNAQISSSAGVEALRRQEQQRQAREDAMRNALEILEWARPQDDDTRASFAHFVKRVAREGLGRE